MNLVIGANLLISLQHLLPSSHFHLPSSITEATFAFLKISKPLSNLSEKRSEITPQGCQQSHWKTANCPSPITTGKNCFTLGLNCMIFLQLQEQSEGMLILQKQCFLR
ncbi:hypothetical protein ACH5RR_015860 [Cinchona calisaya]|uniref:Uncharacterized protein n=1 Tax=Cinchona calisaya TaxID=153742 RepID=A0ABD2ZUD6_9GENT